MFLIKKIKKKVYMADRKFPPRHGARHGAKTIRQFCAKWRQWRFVSFRRHGDSPWRGGNGSAILTRPQPYFWDKFNVLPKIGLFFGSSWGFFRIPGSFQNLTSELVETWYEYKMWGFWDEFKVLPKIRLFFGSFRGFFFRISEIISRTWPKNWLKLGLNTK